MYPRLGRTSWTDGFISLRPCKKDQPRNFWQKAANYSCTPPRFNTFLVFGDSRRRHQVVVSAKSTRITVAGTANPRYSRLNVKHLSVDNLTISNRDGSGEELGEERFQSATAGQPDEAEYRSYDFTCSRHDPNTGNDRKEFAPTKTCCRAGECPQELGT